MSHHAIKGERESDTCRRAETQGMDLECLSDTALIWRMGAGGKGIGRLNKSNRKRLVEIGVIVRTRSKGGFAYVLTVEGREAIRRVRKGNGS